MIIVSDSSVLYAAFSSPKGFCARVIRMSREQGHVLATSDWIIDEVRRHLLSKARL